MRIEMAQEHETGIVLALVEELLAELGEEGQEFTRVDSKKLEGDLRDNSWSARDPGRGCGRFVALLAKDKDGMAVGVLTLSTSFAIYAGGEYGVIDEMYVRPAYRGRGVGRRLVEEALSFARDRGWFRLDVTGPESLAGARAVRFYQGLGFEFTGPKLRRLTGSSVRPS